MFSSSSREAPYPVDTRAVARSAWATGLLWALVYALLATPHLTAQGLYYDEVHQATAAFPFAGSPHVLAAYSINGIPVLNMPYSGAIKSAIYGLGLKATGAPFSILTWRLLGCLFAALGILVMGASAARRLSPLAANAFGFLLATDMTVVLATRHDWGPVALALLLRLLLAAAWLREWNAERASTRGAFIMGLLLGVSLFEKLSSIVIALPVGAAFLLDRRRRTGRSLAAGLAGAIVGSLPLLLVNLHSWRTRGVAISLATSALREKPLPSLREFLPEYAGLGNGASLVQWILGKELPEWIPLQEGSVVLLLCAALVVAGLLAGRSGRTLRAAAVLAALYPLTGLAIEALPAPTSIHHWVIGTPLHYLAFALTLGGARADEPRSRASRVILRWIFKPGLLLLIALRLPPVFAIESYIRADLHSIAFNPETTELAAFANRQPADVPILATEWGIATQMFCLSNGRRASPEIYWDYRGPDDLRRLAQDRPVFFLAAWNGADSHPGVTERALADARALPEFREAPVAETRQWREVRVWRFDRICPSAAECRPDRLDAVPARP